MAQPFTKIGLAGDLSLLALAAPAIGGALSSAFHAPRGHRLAHGALGGFAGYMGSQLAGEHLGGPLTNAAVRWGTHHKDPMAGLALDQMPDSLLSTVTRFSPGMAGIHGVSLRDEGDLLAHLGGGAVGSHLAKGLAQGHSESVRLREQEAKERMNRSGASNEKEAALYNMALAVMTKRAFMGGPAPLPQPGSAPMAMPKPPAPPAAPAAPMGAPGQAAPAAPMKAAPDPVAAAMEAHAKANQQRNNQEVQQLAQTLKNTVPGAGGPPGGVQLPGAQPVQAPPMGQVPNPQGAMG